MGRNRVVAFCGADGEYRKGNALGIDMEPDRASWKLHKLLEPMHRHMPTQIKGVEAPLRPAFLAKPHHSQFALLSFFIRHKDDNSHERTREFLEEEFRIEMLDSVLFSIHEPYRYRP